MTECLNCSRRVGDSLPICVDCTSALVADLLAVPGLVAEMTVTRARQARMSRGRAVGKPAEAPLPYAADRTGAPRSLPLDQLANSVGTWARDLADSMGLDVGELLDRPGLRQIAANRRGSERPDPAALTVDPLLDVDVAAVWLAHNPNELRRHPAADELHADLTRAVETARRAVDSLPELAYKGPCPYTWEGERGDVMKCGADLYAERGGDWARCRRCGTQHDIRHLDRDMLAHMREMNYTVAELVTILGELGTKVSAGTLYSWVNRRKLQPRGWRRKNGAITDHWIHRSDPAVYRLGDAMDLLARDDERAKA